MWVIRVDFVMSADVRSRDNPGNANPNLAALMARRIHPLLAIALANEGIVHSSLAKVMVCRRFWA
jgi:hypothetical protein